MQFKRRAKLEAGDVNRSLHQARNSKRRAVYSILALSAVLGWTYIVFISDVFAISEVEVRGVKALDPMDISKEVFDILDSREEYRPWPARHAWFIDRTKLAAELKARLFVLDATVDNSYGSVLRLKIEERSKRVVFHSHQQYFWIDLQGVATDELTTNEKLDVQTRLLGNRSIRSDEPPIIKRDLDEPVAAGFVLTTPQEAREWIELSERVRASGLIYRELEPPTASSSLFKVLSAAGHNVLMDITAPIEIQVQTYQAFLKNQPENIGKPDYIDVRVPGRVYFK